MMWKKVKLGDVAVISSGNSAPQGDEFFINGIFPFCRTSDVGAVHLSTDLTEIKDKLNDTGIKGLTLFKKGTILIPKSGASTFLNHRAILGLDSYVSSHLATIQTNENFLFNLWAYYFFVTLDAKMLSPDTNYPTLKLSTISNIEIPLPPMEEQKEIAARLDAVSDLLAKQKQLLSEQDNLIQSTFYDMFGDPLKNNKGWKIEKLGNLFSVSSGGTPDTKNKEYWENGDISWIGSNLCQNVILTKNDGKFITQKGLENSSAKIISAGSVLIALVGATIGKTALLTFETTTNQNIAAIDVIKNENFSSYFIFYLIQALNQEFLNIGSGKFKMANLTFVRNLKIPIPPLELQEKFAAIVEQIESEKSKIKSAIAETQTLFNSMMSEYFEE